MVSEAEMDRIRNLPVILPITPEEVEALSEEFVQGPAFRGECNCKMPSCREGKPIRLKADQAAGVRAFRRYRRGFFDIDVGQGKTALAQLCASLWFHKWPESRVLYLLPPNLVRDLFRYHLRWARLHLNAWVPRWINLHNKEPHVRTALVKARQPGIYVVPYSLLSDPGASALLHGIDAQLVIADEAHTLAGNRSTGRTKAFWPWVKSAAPKGVVMSGSFTRQSPEDYHRMLTWTLEDRSPLPRLTLDVQAWAAAIESRASERPLTHEVLAAVKPLVEWAVDEFPNDPRLSGAKWDVRTIRSAYQARFTTAPGVVKSVEGGGIDAPLEIVNFPCRDPKPKLQDYLDTLDEDWVTPDGLEKVHGVEVLEVMRQLSAGFYLHHYWDESLRGVEQAKECRRLRREYDVLLRDFLRSPRAAGMNLLIPSAVGHHHKVHGAIKNWEHMFSAWLEWKDAWREDLPEMSTRPVRVDPFKVNAIVQWAKGAPSADGGVVWIYHTEFGDWVTEALREAGLRPHRKVSGDSWLAGDASDGKIVVASIGAFGQGKNLQHYRHQILGQWCRTATRMQQLLGRLHREGQKADKVVAHTLRVTEFDHQQAYATLLDAIYDKQAHGGDRKLLLAKWRPKPRSYPADFLREQGFGLKQFGALDQEED